MQYVVKNILQSWQSVYITAKKFLSSTCQIKKKTGSDYDIIEKCFLLFLSRQEPHLLDGVAETQVID